VFLEPPGRLRRQARTAARFVDDPDGLGLFHEMRPDFIISPPTFIVTAAQSTLVGFRTVLDADGIFFVDECQVGQHRDWFIRELRSNPGFDQIGLEAAGEGADSFRLNVAGRPIEHIDGTAVLLSSAEPFNYGSFLFRALPKLWACRQMGLQSVRYLFWLGHAACREYLELAGLGDGELVHHDPSRIYRIDRLIVPSVRNNQAFLDSESLAVLADLRARYGVARQPGKRVYVSRYELNSTGLTGRAMRNEGDLIDRLVERGFTIASPETLSAVEQIRLFSSAEMVVGPSGSGMFNTAFCHPGTRIIDIESEPHWLHAHRSFFASCGLDYGIFVGRADDPSFRRHHLPWQVNIDALLARIDWFADI
jgi:capsular polysaccharide biosynthesis protein